MELFLFTSWDEIPALEQAGLQNPSLQKSSLCSRKCTQALQELLFPFLSTTHHWICFVPTLCGSCSFWGALTPHYQAKEFCFHGVSALSGKQFQHVQLLWRIHLTVPAFLLELLEGKLAPHQHSLLLWGATTPVIPVLCAFHELLVNSDLLSALRSVFASSDVSSPVLGV